LADRQTLMVRRTIAVVAGLLVVVLLVLGVRGCLNARKERAVRDYGNSAVALARESNQQGAALFDLLSGGGAPEGPVDITNSLNGLRVQSAQLVDRSRDLDVPDEVSQAQRYLVEALELRRDGLAVIGDSLPTALGDEQQREGSDRIVAQMQVFLASDVIYTARFRPSLGAALREEELAAEVSVPDRTFVPDIEWLQPTFVADAISGIRGDEGGGGAVPGLHGNGLVAVSLGGVALTPGASSTVQLTDDVAFDVQVANQGENTETDVTVQVRVGEGDDAISLEETLDTIAAGETKAVTLPLSDQPPTGQNVAIEVEVRPVPGEEKTDNNSQTYSVIFTR
jgi:hypothetical protein